MNVQRHTALALVFDNTPRPMAPPVAAVCAFVMIWPLWPPLCSLLQMLAHSSSLSKELSELSLTHMDLETKRQLVLQGKGEPLQRLDQPNVTCCFIKTTIEGG